MLTCGGDGDIINSRNDAVNRMAQIRTRRGDTVKKAPKKQGKEISAERLRSLREEKGATQEEVAKLLNLSRSTIVKMETAHQDIKTGYLQSLAQFYETSTDYILGLTEVRRSPETLPACDELGISDAATAKLEMMKDYPLHGRVLSKLIEHDDFETLLRRIESAILSFEPGSHGSDVDMKSLTASAKGAGYALIPDRQKKSYELYMASMTLQAILTDVLDNFYPVSIEPDAEEKE